MTIKVLIMTISLYLLAATQDVTLFVADYKGKDHEMAWLKYIDISIVR
jgi:hypothetical protein